MTEKKVEEIEKEWNENGVDGVKREKNRDLLCLFLIVYWITTIYVSSLSLSLSLLGQCRHMFRGHERNLDKCSIDSNQSEEKDEGKRSAETAQHAVLWSFSRFIARNETMAQAVSGQT